MYWEEEEPKKWDWKKWPEMTGPQNPGDGGSGQTLSDTLGKSGLEWAREVKDAHVIGALHPGYFSGTVEVETESRAPEVRKCSPYLQTPLQ